MHKHGKTNEHIKTNVEVYQKWTPNVTSEDSFYYMGQIQIGRFVMDGKSDICKLKKNTLLLFESTGYTLGLNLN